MSINLNTSIELVSDQPDKFQIDKLLDNFKKKRIMRQNQRLERKINDYWLLYSADSEFRKETAKLFQLNSLKIDFNTFKSKVLKNLNPLEKIFLEKKLKF